jgi:protein required for attachment to host cells
MEIANKSLVVVADGRKMLFFRNEGDALYPNLALDRVREQDNPADRDQKSDAPGVAYSSVGNSRHSFSEVDFHQLEEDRFASETADLLKKRALANDFESLIIVAPPKTLGELRKHYHKEVESRLVGEIAKDLTGHPVDEIEKIIVAA